MPTTPEQYLTEAVAKLNEQRRVIVCHPDQAHAIRTALDAEPYAHLITVIPSDLLDLGTAYVMPYNVAMVSAPLDISPQPTSSQP